MPTKGTPKYCPRCKKYKPRSDFGKHTIGLRSYCKICHSEYNSQFYNAKKHREVCRRTTLTTGTRTIYGLHKRPYPNFCEICGVERVIRLHYHHWDDINPSRGIWICAYCHRLVEFFEKGLIDFYLEKYGQLKIHVNESVKEDNLDT